MTPPPPRPTIAHDECVLSRIGDVYTCIRDHNPGHDGHVRFAANDATAALRYLRDSMSGPADEEDCA